jgi:uncharacterized membrane protein YgaE (UPF0421/DUF939 family)
MASGNKLALNTLRDAVRTTVAAALAMLLARLLKLPEFYWAPISAIVIIQSTIDPKTLAWQRFAGTALGAAMGALIGTVLPASPTNTWVYAGAIFLAGVVCVLLRFRGAYRFAAITLSIVLLIAHTRVAWIVAWHRFVEVSLGIAVALAIALLWPVKADY